MSICMLSGGITGIANHNHPAFNKKAKELHEQGYIVLNPASLPLGMTRDQYMSICLLWVDIADCVYFLYGWQYSKGSREEFDFAVSCGKRLLFEEPIDHTQFIKGDA